MVYPPEPVYHPPEGCLRSVARLLRNAPNVPPYSWILPYHTDPMNPFSTVPLRSTVGWPTDWLSRPLRWFNRILGRSVVERSFPSRWPLLALDRVWVRPRPALLALKAHRSRMAERASDHLPVKAIVATQNLRWESSELPRERHLRAVGSR